MAELKKPTRHRSANGTQRPYKQDKSWVARGEEGTVRDHDRSECRSGVGQGLGWLPARDNEVDRADDRGYFAGFPHARTGRRDPCGVDGCWAEPQFVSAGPNGVEAVLGFRGSPGVPVS